MRACCMYSDDSGCIHFIKSDDDRVEKKGENHCLTFSSSLFVP